MSNVHCIHCGNAEKGEDDYENSINDRRERFQMCIRDRRISVPQKGIEAQKLFTEFLGFFIAYDLRGFSDVTWSCGPVKGLSLIHI